MIPNANVKERKTKLQPVPENIVNIRRKIVFIFCGSDSVLDLVLTLD